MTTPFRAEKLGWLGLPMVKRFEDTITRFDTIHERGRHTNSIIIYCIPVI